MWLHSVADIKTEPVLRPDPASLIRNRITLVGPESSVRRALQNFIHQRYAEAYQADVSHFLPLLLASVTGSDIQGVLGLRPGSAGRFFVEQYLADPIELAITTVTGQTVDRTRVIETGNLASIKGGSQRLFIVLTELLWQAGFDWVCFTATPQVASLLQRLGFAPEVLASADPACLSDSGRSWGSYYRNKPSVLVGDVTKARHTLLRNELAMRLLQDSAEEVQAAVAALTAFSRRAATDRGGDRG